MSATTNGNSNTGFTGIHIDLKYHMPRKRYLTEWVCRLPAYGVDTILLEYEDAFPYQKYPFLRAANAFTPDELHAFLDAARGAGLKIIPLVQSYAHLEFALRHEELAHLRELPDLYAKACTLKPQTHAFILDMVEEVLAYHQDDQLFHLGGDEVWHTAWCAACQARVDRDGTAPMWCDHMRPLLQRILDAGKRPIVWDDIFWRAPEAIATADLPKATILHAWNYGITSLKPKNAAAAANLEWGDTGGVLQQVDTYQKAGFDVVAGPCYNVGQLFPRHEHSLKNTQVWAQKMRANKMVGMLNTAWAVFHIPFQIMDLYAAATGALCRDPDHYTDEAWQRDWLRQAFGCQADGVPAALETLGKLWELPTPEYERPFTAIIYGYMNMVFHYPNRHKDRTTIGPYPPDWAEVDFNAIQQKGIAAAKQQPGQEKINAELDQLLRDYPAAVAALAALAQNAQKLREEAAMLATFAALKHLSLRLFALQFRDDGDRAALAGAWRVLRPQVREALALAWEAQGAERMWRAFCSPLEKLLTEIQGTNEAL